MAEIYQSVFVIKYYCKMSHVSWNRSKMTKSRRFKVSIINVKECRLSKFLRKINVSSFFSFAILIIKMIVSILMHMFVNNQSSTFYVRQFKFEMSVAVYFLIYFCKNIFLFTLIVMCWQMAGEQHPFRVTQAKSTLQYPKPEHGQIVCLDTNWFIHPRIQGQLQDLHPHK